MVINVHTHTLGKLFSARNTEVLLSNQWFGLPLATLELVHYRLIPPEPLHGKHHCPSLDLARKLESLLFTAPLRLFVHVAHVFIGYALLKFVLQGGQHYREEEKVAKDSGEDEVEGREVTSN